MENINAIIANNTIQQQQSATNVLEKDDFLKLMMMQMQNQDPLNPMDNQAMLSQMAQFSSLEQMSNLNSTMTESNAFNSFIQTAQLLGKQVEILDPTAPAGEAGTVRSTVKSVNFTSDGPVITLNNGMVTSTQQILSLGEENQTTSN